jgi:hypothetical protein
MILLMSVSMSPLLFRLLADIVIEVEYNLGFVEAVPRPKPTIGGWLRVVTPLLILPDYQVSLRKGGQGEKWS